MANVAIIPESSIDSLGAEAVFLQELCAKQLLTSLREVPVGLSQGEFNVHVLEKGKHDLQLSNLAILVQGQHINIIG